MEIHVAYSATRDIGNGVHFAYAHLTLSSEEWPLSHDDIMNIVRTIEHENEVHNVVIISWQKLRTTNA